MRDQGLVPRLNCLKRCFSSPIRPTSQHFLDLAHTELRKTAKALSLVKLQSLLDLALGTDAHGDDAPFREDVHYCTHASIRARSTNKRRRQAANLEEKLTNLSITDVSQFITHPSCSGAFLHHALGQGSGVNTMPSEHDLRGASGARVRPSKLAAIPQKQCVLNADEFPVLGWLVRPPTSSQWAQHPYRADSCAAVTGQANGQWARVACP